MTPQEIPEYINGLPNICGSEDLVNQARNRSGAIYLPQSGIDFERVRSAFSIALHMHQPLFPRAAATFNGPNHQQSQVHDGQSGIGDNHNAPVFQRCYKRMGEFIPQLCTRERTAGDAGIFRHVLHGLRRWAPTM